MFFEISKHLFDSHPFAVVAQGQRSIGQIGRQAPGFLLALLPVDQDRNGMDLALVKYPFGHQAGCPAFCMRLSSLCQPLCSSSHNPVLPFWRRAKNQYHFFSCCKNAIEPNSLSPTRKTGVFCGIRLLTYFNRTIYFAALLCPRTCRTQDQAMGTAR